MSAPELQVSERAAELRRAFDRSFVEAQHFEAVATEDFLAIHVGGDPHALHLAEISGLYVDKKVTAVPSLVEELLGIAGFRGAMLPVYDLAALLRYPRAGEPRWLAVAAEAPVAFAFERFDGHFRAPREAVASHDGDRAGEHLRQIIRTDDFIRPLINIPSLVVAIRSHASTSGLQ